MTLAILRVRLSLCQYLIRISGAVYDAAISTCRRIERFAGKASERVDMDLACNAQRLNARIEAASQQSHGDLALSRILLVVGIYCAIAFAADVYSAYTQHLAAQFAESEANQ